ncbi:MAG: hypothetical protein FWD68_18670 [Alphaproteobacteria bacterium]|nr:hypothetical protein [Alphaproteobacteria bacterium]
MERVENPLSERIIELSRGKTVLLAVGAAAFVAAGWWMWGLEEDAPILRGDSAAFVHAVGMISMLFFGACGIILLFQLFDRKTAYVLNESGINYKSRFSAWNVPWSDILGARIEQIFSQKMIVIELRNPEKYLECGRLNHRMVGSPVVITTNALNIGTPEFLEIFDQFRRRYGNG